MFRAIVIESIIYDEKYNNTRVSEWESEWVRRK